MSNSLYDLSNELALINDELAESGGELPDELEIRLDSLSLSFNQKVEGIVKWSKNLEGRESALDKEIARLCERKKATENLRDRLKKYMLESMQRAGKTKVEMDTFTVAIQKNPASLEVVDPEAVPATYKTIRQEVVLDRRQMLDDLKAGKPLEGAKLADPKFHLRIR